MANNAGWRKRPVTYKHMDEAVNKELHETSTEQMIIWLSVMTDKFGWGRFKCRKVWDGLQIMSDDIANDFRKAEKIVNELGRYMDDEAFKAYKPLKGDFVAIIGRQSDPKTFTGMRKGGEFVGISPTAAAIINKHAAHMVEPTIKKQWDSVPDIKFDGLVPTINNNEATQKCITIRNRGELEQECRRVRANFRVLMQAMICQRVREHYHYGPERLARMVGYIRERTGYVDDKSVKLKEYQKCLQEEAKIEAK